MQNYIVKDLFISFATIIIIFPFGNVSADSPNEIRSCAKAFPNDKDKFIKCAQIDSKTILSNSKKENVSNQKKDSYDPNEIMGVYTDPNGRKSFVTRSILREHPEQIMTMVKLDEVDERELSLLWKIHKNKKNSYPKSNNSSSLTQEKPSFFEEIAYSILKGVVGGAIDKTVNDALGIDCSEETTVKARTGTSVPSLIEGVPSIEKTKVTIKSKKPHPACQKSGLYAP